jgi:arabinose-5-phosphate isomerase
MTKNPVSVRNDLFAVDVLKVFESRKIDDLPVIDENGLVVGYIDIQDLPKMKVL